MTAATKTVPSQTNKPTAAPKETTMATPKIDTSAMSVEEMLKHRAHEASQKLFDDTINFLDDKLKAMGRTKVQAVFALHELMTEQEQKDLAAYFKSKQGGATPHVRKGRNAPKEEKVYKDWDSEKQRPQVGKTYKLADGTTWTRKGEQGATKKEFIAAVTTGGKKWSELLVK